jgi:hypothetical protein
MEAETMSTGVGMRCSVLHNEKDGSGKKATGRRRKKEENNWEHRDPKKGGI